MSRTRATAARRLLPVLIAAAVALSACSSGSDSASSSEGAGASTTPATTPSGRPGATEVAVVTTEPPQTQVQSGVIEMPAELLTTTTAPPVRLATDYEPAPTDESIVLEATVANVRIYDSATATTPRTTLANPLPSGTPLTFLVDGQTSTRYKVLLPTKPNGSTGWLDPGDVGVKKSHKFQIEVDLSAHRIIVTNAGKVILEEKIAVGKGATPTPDGRYYIKELLKPPDPNGAYGPYAYGLSGYSPIVQNFKGGDDTIGIHGTNEPQLLGQDVSHGCIRMSNAGITTLSKILPLGTPVVVRA